MDQQQALKFAARWYARLCSGQASAADEQALEEWLQQHPLHRWAWGRVEVLQKQLSPLSGTSVGNLAMDTLDRSERHVQGRRTFLKSIAVLAATGSLGWISFRHSAASLWLADQHTITGEIRRLTLDDNSVLILDTASAVDVAFTAHERRLRLRQGEILVETAKPADTRPFIVETAHGQVRALGTRFSVREREQQSRVTVFQHRVEVTLPNGQQRILAAGQAADFDASGISQKSAVPNSDAWTRGILAVNDMPLDAFVAELARYRQGLLQCDPALGRHRISGAFRLDNTDQALQAITKSFPVQVRYRTRFWASLEPR